MELHYDPAYRRGRRKDGRPAMAVVALETLDRPDLDRAADEIARQVLKLSAGR